MKKRRQVVRKVLLFAVRYAFALGGALYLFLFGFCRPRGRALIRQMCRHFGFDLELQRTIIPTADIGEWAGSSANVRVLEPVGRDGNISLLELLILNQVVSSRRPKGIFEFGTFDGRTTLNMAANSDGDALIHTIDLPQALLSVSPFRVESSEVSYIRKDESGTRFLGREEAARIRQLYGDTASFDFGPYHGQYDLVFIDASHAYEYVINDSRIALKLLRDGRGTVIWHDYGEWPGVTEALNELSAEPSLSGMRHIGGTTLVICEFR